MCRQVFWATVYTYERVDGGGGRNRLYALQLVEISNDEVIPSVLQKLLFEVLRRMQIFARRIGALTSTLNKNTSSILCSYYGEGGARGEPMFPLSCAAAHVAKKRRAAVSNCRAVIFNVICVICT